MKGRWRRPISGMGWYKDVKKRFADLGVEAVSRTPEQFGLPSEYHATPFAQRWDSIRSAGMIMGAASLSTDLRNAGRAIIVEIGIIGAVARVGAR